MKREKILKITKWVLINEYYYYYFSRQPISLERRRMLLVEKCRGRGFEIKRAVVDLFF